jgi:Metallo-beta-lactamase superfamily
LSAPSSNEIEITLFGPGFGESVVIHACDNEWVIVDSCIDSVTGNTAALDYLRSIGVDVSTSVKLVIATHWHDDHIRGMSQLVRECTSAVFACSVALTREEFLEVADLYSKRPISVDAAGPSEIYQTLKELRERRQGLRRAIADRPLFRTLDAQGRVKWEVTALSPVDEEVERFLAGISALLPPPGVATTKSRLPKPAPNDLSVAAWVTIADVRILLGADLEEHGVATRGWSAVLASRTRPPGVASFFKISHHGSVTGHHNGIWAGMLENNPTAALTPWTLGASVLPKANDVARTAGLTSNGYSSSRLTAPGLQALPPAVGKILREANIKIRSAQPPMGFVRFRTPRCPPAIPPSTWTLVAAENAVQLR